MNINYIRAAIEAHTGTRLTLKETARYLLEEKLVTKAQCAKLMFPGYVNLFPSEKREPKGRMELPAVVSVDVIVANPQATLLNERNVWNDN